ncbi:MAG: hypothetical protein A4E36_00151 [Methanoregulaceae archaeon PtaB.Bin009]|nr:MAG: hypothetical protein A4E36_00151 [Methanoregulaceae archaeon PtaB.Bin009]OPY40335.1 MAG: hypothetical protein A4E41_01432 [Methanoregulaceae archaeon PtaU1.Bin066]
MNASARVSRRRNADGSDVPVNGAAAIYPAQNGRTQRKK